MMEGENMRYTIEDSIRYAIVTAFALFALLVIVGLAM